MDRNYLIQLTQKLYRLTFLFPKKEPLRYKMREVGDEILADLIPGPELKENVFEKLEVLNSFFEITKTQNWVSFNEILQLQEEYIRLKGELSDLSLNGPQANGPQVKVKSADPPLALTTEVQYTNSVSLINERQKKILDILKEKAKAQVWEVKKVFPEVSKRTLRRDFERLLKQGLIERIGESNNTFYILKGRTI